MASNKDTTLISTIPPPAKEKLVVKDRMQLVLQLLWWAFKVVPSLLLYTIYRKVFPLPGKSLKGQVVIVTGAGRGMGRGLALRFAAEGAKVAVVDIDANSAFCTAKTIEDAGGTAKPYTTNVASITNIHQLRLSIEADLGAADILVNNAGLIYTESLQHSTEAEVRSVIEVNLLSHFWIVKEFLPVMKSRNSGHIVAISSLSALRGIANLSAYAASKCGVMGFMDALRDELNSRPDNKIKTTTVLPYFVNTSEYYFNQWEIRFPPLTIEEFVEDTINAVKKDEVILSIPKSMFFRANFLKLLPTEIQDNIYSIIYTRINLSAKGHRDKNPEVSLINYLTKRRQE